MLKFKKSSEQVSSLKTVGTVSSLVGTNGYHELASEKNFKGEMLNGILTQKKVSIKLVNAEGDYQYITCSKPVSAWLRESSSETELKERLANLSAFPILELPQFDAVTKEPVMVDDEETGESIQLVLYSISFTGGTDMSSTRTTVTAEMIKQEVVKRSIKFEDLIAL
jgi:hypothetical protein